MSNKVFITHQELQQRANEIASRMFGEGIRKVFPVPRGGIPCVYLVCAAFAARYPSAAGLKVVQSPEEADAILDDIIDSGRTKRAYQSQYPIPFYAFYDDTNKPDGWLVFPWENREGANEDSIEDNVVRLLQFIGEDPARGGLNETPKRFAKACLHWFSGYMKEPKELLKVFEDGAQGVDEMVIVKDIPIYSHCEHHIAPIFGTATIAYIPNGKIVGLSKLSRLADAFARRLQVQERLTNQIADALDEHLAPLGVGVIIRARHMCMESRGVCQQGHHTITCALRGVLKTSPEARAEFMELAK